MSAKADILRSMKPIRLTGAKIVCHTGIVGIDADASMIYEAGIDYEGTEYVSFVARASELSPKRRRAAADAAIRLWEKFAAGGSAA